MENIGINTKKKYFLDLKGTIQDHFIMNYIELIQVLFLCSNHTLLFFSIGFV